VFKNWRKKIFLLLFGAVFSFGLGEIGARVLFGSLPPMPGAYWRADSDCGYRLNAGAPETRDPSNPEYINSLGFRDRDRPIEKSAGTYRVLGLGDSFVYGAVTPDKNFLRVAETTLNALSAPDSKEVDIPMLGCPGWSVENEAGLLQSQGMEMQPDLVVLNFFVGNDVTGIPVRGTVIRGDLYFSGSTRKWLDTLRKSQLFMMAERTILLEVRNKWLAREINADDQSEMMVGTAVNSGSDSLAPVGVNHEYLIIQNRSKGVYSQPTEPWVEDLWQEAEEQLLEVHQACKQAGIPWVLVFIPTEVQVDEAVRKQVYAGLNQDEADYDFDLPQRRLLEFAQKSGIEVLDLLPEFRKAQDPDSVLYFPNDTHWNERGNQLAGRLLAERIQELR
jgi:hypothetical protein